MDNEFSRRTLFFSAAALAAGAVATVASAFVVTPTYSKPVTAGRLTDLSDGFITTHSYDRSGWLVPAGPSASSMERS